jgi:hypothetical protein
MTLQTNDALVPDDGTRFRLRPIDPSDYGGVSGLFAGLSPESRDQRFLSPKSELSPHDLSYLTDVDRVRHVAIAAVDGSDGSIVGVRRDVQTDDQAGVADVAIVVVDELQGMGNRYHPRDSHRAARLREWCRDSHSNDPVGEPPARALLRSLRFRVHASNCHQIEHVLKLSRGAQASSPPTDRKPT